MKMLKEYYWYKSEEGTMQYIGYDCESSQFIFERDEEYVSYDSLEGIDLDSGVIYCLDCDAADFFAKRLVDLIEYKKTMHSGTEEMELQIKKLVKGFEKYADLDEDVKIEDIYLELMKYYRRLWV